MRRHDSPKLSVKLRTETWSSIPGSPSRWPPIVGLIIALSCYTVGLVYVGFRSGIWTTDVLKDTVLWFLVAGLPLVFGISGSAKRGYFAHAAIRSIQVTALLEFYLNLFVFN